MRQKATIPLDVNAEAMREYVAAIAQPPDRDTTPQIIDDARKLYSAIWGPISREPLSYRNVYIYAEDDFQDFPFEALLGGRQWVGRAAVIHYLTKAPDKSMPGGLPRFRDGANYAYAPFPERQELHWARREAHLVASYIGAQLREGSSATKQQFLADISKPFSILHVATHGFETSSPARPTCIALHKAGSVAGSPEWYDEVTSSGLGTRRINGRLVVLSACAPSAPSARDFSRTFLKQGVREVISSRFSIDDAAAFTLMNAFYSEIRRGVDSGTALLRARSVMIDGNYPAYQHPYFWAAFRSFI